MGAGDSCPRCACLVWRPDYLVHVTSWPLIKGTLTHITFQLLTLSSARRRGTLKPFPASKLVFVIFFLWGNSVKRNRLLSVLGGEKMEESFSWLRAIDEDRAAVLQQEANSLVHLPSMRCLLDGAFWMTRIWFKTIWFKIPFMGEIEVKPESIIRWLKRRLRKIQKYCKYSLFKKSSIITFISMSVE